MQSPALFRFPLRSKLDGAVLASFAAMGAFNLLVLARQVGSVLLA